MDDQEYPMGESPEYAKVEAAFGATKVDSKLAAADEAQNQALREKVQNIDPYALSDSWSRGREYKKPFNHTIEASGQTVQLRRLDMGDLLKLGIAEEMDFMTKALMTSNNKESGQEAVSSAIMKSDNFDRMESMINKVCHAGLLKPKVLMPPLHENARQDGMLYVDEIPFGDRMELFSVIFESDGLATFRGEQIVGVGNVETIPSVQLPAD